MSVYFVELITHVNISARPGGPTWAYNVQVTLMTLALERRLSTLSLSVALSRSTKGLDPFESDSQTPPWFIRQCTAVLFWITS